MLQRAASNAYSWWWASHIRTKQSKWLEQSLQDMEEKTQHVLGLIQEEGDSFAKRAEMYYKRRPELISCVEESYRAFRALAERYDHISKELQNANNTLATCFPEQFQMPMDEDDDPDTPRTPRFPIQVPPSDPLNVPKVPNLPMKNLKTITSASNKLKQLKTAKAFESKRSVNKSGLSKDQAIEEIDKLHKDILALQTVKEFVKSSYQSGLEKYYNIENIILEKQQRVFELQDEFGVQKVIEDDEARKLMAEAALKSCQETLSHLQETQQKSANEAKEEGKKIEDARKRIDSIRNRYLPGKTDAENKSKKDESIKTGERTPKKDESIKTGDGTPNSSKGLGEIFQDNLKLQFDISSMSTITVTELAEKIDELVTKVVTLENAVSSQTILIERLRSEALALHGHIQTLEDDKTDLTGGTGGTEGLSKKVKELEEKLKGIQDLNRNVENQSSNLETHFADAQSSLNNLSDRLTSVQPDEEPQDNSVALKEGVKSVSPTQDQEKSRQDQEKQKELTSIDSIDIGNPSETGETKAKEHPDTQTSANVPEEKETGDTKGKQHPDTQTSTNVQEEMETGDTKAQKHPDTQTSANVQEEMEKGDTKAQKHPDTQTSDNVQEEMEKGDTKAQKHPDTQTSANVQEEISKSPTKKEVRFVEPNVENNTEQQTTTVAETSDETKDSNEGKDKNDLNWQLMLLDGDEDRERILIKEYTTILRNYKDVKRKLNDVETKNKHGQKDISMQFKELNLSIAKRDSEIQRLRRKLNDIQGDDQKTEDAGTDKEDDDFKMILSEQSTGLSPVEETLRSDIDSILDENLGFWLRFSSAFSQIQKFKTTVEDLHGEIIQIREKKQQGDYDSRDKKSEVRPLYKHLKEIQAELAMWLEKCTTLKEEMEKRFSSLCNIQEKISAALKESVEQDDIIFSSHQAAKFQGEILNMKQENNRVKEELKAGFDHITILKEEVDSSLTKMTEEFGLAGNQTASLSHLSSKARIPLRSFLFGSRKKPSIFSRITPNKKYQALRAGVPP